MRPEPLMRPEHAMVRTLLVRGMLVGLVAGMVSLTGISRGSMQTCMVGYFVDEASNGHGFATEAVALALRFAFGPARLHRVQAAVMPHNVRSATVVRRNGFRHEGHAPRYLRLDGAWRDHDIYAITAEEIGTVTSG